MAGPSAIWGRKAVQHCFGQGEPRTQRVETPKRKEKTQMGAFKAASLHRESARWGCRDDVKAPIAEDQARRPVFGAEILPGSCHRLVPQPKVVVLPSTVPESITV